MVFPVHHAGVIPYPYRPDADLLYLTGLTQPSCIAAISSDASLTLFVPERDRWAQAGTCLLQPLLACWLSL